MVRVTIPVLKTSDQNGWCSFKAIFQAFLEMEGISVANVEYTIDVAKGKSPGTRGQSLTDNEEKKLYFYILQSLTVEGTTVAQLNNPDGLGSKAWSNMMDLYNKEDAMMMINQLHKLQQGEAPDGNATDIEKWLMEQINLATSIIDIGPSIKAIVASLIMFQLPKHPEYNVMVTNLMNKILMEKAKEHECSHQKQ